MFSVLLSACFLCGCLHSHQVLSTAVKPVLLGGPRLRAWKRAEAFMKLADALGCAVAVTADAKGMFPEDHPNFIGRFIEYLSTLFGMQLPI